MRSKCDIELLDIVEELLDVLLEDRLAEDQRGCWKVRCWKVYKGFVGLKGEIHSVR